MNDADRQRDDSRKRFEDWAVRHLPVGASDLRFNTADQFYPDLNTDCYYRTWLAGIEYRDANRLIMVDGQVYDQRDVERLVREREKHAGVMREVQLPWKVILLDDPEGEKVLVASFLNREAAEGYTNLYSGSAYTITGPDDAQHSQQSENIPDGH